MATHMIEATHTTRGAHRTWHVRNGAETLGTIDHLKDGTFKSYVVGQARQHGNLAAALVRIGSANSSPWLTDSGLQTCHDRRPL